MMPRSKDSHFIIFSRLLWTKNTPALTGGARESVLAMTFVDELFILMRLNLVFALAQIKTDSAAGSRVCLGVANVYEAGAGSSVGGEAMTKRCSMPRRR